MTLRIARRLLIVALVGGSAFASAQVNFNSINATYSMNPNSGTINWLVFPNNPNGTIDFSQNAPAFKIGDSTSYGTGTSTITYDVTSSVAISSVDLLLQGDVENFGRIQWTQNVTDVNGSLGSNSGTIEGSSWGGTDGAFTYLAHLDFSQAVTSFSVTQTMATDLNGETPPTSSIASVGLVEQDFTAVPEPTSMAALAFGLAAVARRRRKAAA